MVSLHYSDQEETGEVLNRFKKLISLSDRPRHQLMFQLSGGAGSNSDKSGISSLTFNRHWRLEDIMYKALSLYSTSPSNNIIFFKGRGV